MSVETLPLAPGVRIVGEQRNHVARALKAAYADGDSIRTIAARHGRSYGFVHRVLIESGTTLRKRGGAHL